METKFIETFLVGYKIKEMVRSRVKLFFFKFFIFFSQTFEIFFSESDFRISFFFSATVETMLRTQGVIGASMNTALRVTSSRIPLFPHPSLPHPSRQQSRHYAGLFGNSGKPFRKKKATFGPTSLGLNNRNPEHIQPILLPNSDSPQNLLGTVFNDTRKRDVGAGAHSKSGRQNDIAGLFSKNDANSNSSNRKNRQQFSKNNINNKSNKSGNSENKNNKPRIYSPVDLLSSPKVKRFYDVCQISLQGLQKTNPTIVSLLATSPGTDERKEAIDKTIKQILQTIEICSQHNTAGIWDLVRMDDSELTHSIATVFDQYQKDINATDTSYQEYENDITAFQNYIENPPLVPTLGRIFAVLENSDFLDVKLAKFPSKHSTSSSNTTLPNENPDHGLINSTARLFASSFLRYFRAKVRIQYSLDSKSSYRSDLDMTRPGEWYPGARAFRRNVYLHIGPTNSGKTYQALQALRKAKSGYYAGPLRLLAREIFNRFRAEGKLCNLITGEEVLEYLDEFGLPCKVSSGTIEMIDTNRPMDVAVIDEIQMIEDETRGWAWTHAFLGVQAKEIHLCGDPSSESIIRKLVAETGDNLVIKKYERLSKLVAEKAPVKSLKPGDCIVAFSRRELLDQKAYVEEKMKTNCSIIYGALPPESRSRQAELFNEYGNDYKFLVASDAVGMGLNLSIKRIIFLTTMKFNGQSRQRVSISQIKQIAGRAGRYRIAPSNSDSVVEPDDKEADSSGYVTAFDKRDLKYVTQCLNSKTPVIHKGGLFPSESSFREYALLLFNQEPFDKILERIEVASNVSSVNFLSGVHNMVEISQLFRGINGLTLNEQLVLSKAPVKTGNDKCILAFQRFCMLIAKSESASLLDLPEVGIQNLSMNRPFSKEDISLFESTHSIIVLYLWLSYRFPLNFMDRKGAFECKELCERLIDQGLLDTRSKRLESWKRKTEKNREKEEQEMLLRPVEENVDTEMPQTFDINVDQNVAGTTNSIQ